jgi:hypothetical protein
MNKFTKVVVVLNFFNLSVTLLISMGKLLIKLLNLQAIYTDACKMYYAIPVCTTYFLEMNLWVGTC